MTRRRRVAPPSPIDPSAELAPAEPLVSVQDVRTAPWAGMKKNVVTTWPSSQPGDRSSEPLPPGLPYAFRYDDLDVRDLPDTIRPYALTRPFPLQDKGIHDAEGVRMVYLGGRYYDHPVAQAQYGINLLESFRLTGDTTYLRRAEKQAQRLVDRRVERSGGWFYPYPFRYQLHRQYQIYEPPWYSMMAQGQALSLFCRLHRVTGATAWRTAADRTFASFLVPAVAGRPWGVYVVDGYLWLEEYPRPDVVRGDRTYNGHTFSAYGLWDYWVLSGSEQARALLRGALTTTRDLYQSVRNRHWRSKYCLAHAKDSGPYHTTHIAQHLQAYAITRDVMFAKIAELYCTDHPPHGVRGTVTFGAGTHTGYRFDADGRVLASKVIRLTRRSSAPSGDRGKVMRQTGVWYSITAGALEGYRVRETPGAVYQVGTYATYGYRIPRPVRALDDGLRAYSISSRGAMTRVTTDYRAGQILTVDARAVLNGVEHLRLESGPHAGLWVGYSHVARV